MTKKKYALCKKIISGQNLPIILQNTKIPDYMTLQIEFGSGELVFSNDAMDGTTIVTVREDILEEYEHQREAHFQQRFSFWISLISLGISIVALLKP